MREYLPYVVSIVCALISGITSCIIARKQTQNDIRIIVKQHEADIDGLERKHQLEIERIKLEHTHQLELQEKENETKLSSALITEAMKIPEIRKQISQGMREGMHK